MKRFLIPVLALLTLSLACGKSASNIYSVENTTSQDFEMHWVHEGDSTHVVLKEGETSVFYAESGYGVEMIPAQEFLRLFDALYITVNDSQNYISDIYAYDNWIHQFDGSKASHKLIVSDSDIQ